MMRTKITMNSDIYRYTTSCSSLKSTDVSKEYVATVFLRNIGWHSTDYCFIFQKLEVFFTTVVRTSDHIYTHHPGKPVEQTGTLLP
jgi:hypothetical protein